MTNSPHHRTTSRHTRVIAAAIALALASAGCAAHPRTPIAPTGRDLAAVPAGVRWITYRSIAIPVGDDGPHHIDVAATGFAHTPQGAALAGIDHTVQLSIADDTDWPAVAAAELAAGPGKDAWVTSRVLVSLTSPTDPARAPVVRGYTITHYSASRADIVIFTSFPDRSATSTDVTLVWTREDWLLQLPDPASREPRVKSVAAVGATVRLERPR